MSILRVYVDFHNADAEGRLRLNCVGTIQSLNRQQIELHEGLRLTFFNEDLEVEGKVHFSKEENLWVSVIDWNAIRQLESEPNFPVDQAAEAEENKYWRQGHYVRKRG
jgi:hypothetical protein